MPSLSERVRFQVIAAWNVLTVTNGSWLIKAACAGTRPGEGEWTLKAFPEVADTLPPVLTASGLVSGANAEPFRRMHLVTADRESFEARFETDDPTTGLHVSARAEDSALRLLIVAPDGVETVASAMIEATGEREVTVERGLYSGSLLIPDAVAKLREPFAPLSGTAIYAEAAVSLR